MSPHQAARRLAPGPTPAVRSLNPRRGPARPRGAMPSTSDALDLSPVPDGVGGASVALPPGTAHARLHGPALRALDVRADAALRVLDLRDCAPGVHLTLEGTGPIERILLPPGVGAVLNLALAGVGESLTLDGPVKTLSAIWPSARARGGERCVEVSTRRAPPLQGVRLGPLTSPRDERVESVEAWVVVGGRLEREAFDAGAPSHLWLVECSAPDGLAFSAPLGRLELCDVEIPSLVFPSAAKVRIRPCGQLAQISGHTPHLVLRGGAAIDELVIEGDIDEADLLDVHCRTLRVLGCRRLRLERVEGIRDLHALGVASALDLRTQGPTPEIAGRVRQRVHAPTPPEIEAQFVHGSEAGREAMLAWARRCKRPGDLQTALRELREARRRAARLGLARLVQMVDQQLAIALQRSGKPEAALALLDATLVRDGAAMSPCDRADLLTNVGWVSLLARDARASAPSAAAAEPAKDAKDAKDAKGNFDRR